MALVTDYTQPNFDAYLDLLTASNRLTVWGGMRSEEGWITSPEERKEQWLREATVWVRDYAIYQGTQVGAISGSVAVWPRTDVYALNGTKVTSDAVPQFVIDATLHRALDFSEGMGLPQTEVYSDPGETTELNISTLKLKKSPTSQRKSEASQRREQEMNSYAARILASYVYYQPHGFMVRG